MLILIKPFFTFILKPVPGFLAFSKTPSFFLRTGSREFRLYDDDFHSPRISHKFFTLQLKHFYLVFSFIFLHYERAKNVFFLVSRKICNYVSTGKKGVDRDFVRCHGIFLFEVSNTFIIKSLHF